MKIRVISRGETVIGADGDYEEPPIRAALMSFSAAEAADDYVASAIIDCTDSERSDISHDEYAIVTEDDGTPLWEGWLDGADEPAPDSDSQQRHIDQMHDLIRDMLTAYPALAIELPAFQDRAGRLYVHDTDGQPFSGCRADGDGPPIRPKLAPELAEAHGYRRVAHEMLRSFEQSGDGHWHARVGNRVFDGWLKRANGDAS